jgi:hypothetical protein
MWANVRMGDSPDDLVSCRWPHTEEATARTEAREWVGGAVDVAYFDLPQPARITLLYAVRRGAAEFF